MKIAVIGAGYMGSALTFPLCESRHSVRLAGTHLDNDIIKKCIQGNAHPRLKKNIPEAVSLFYSDDIKKALREAEAVVIAVLSEGFSDVIEFVLDNIEAAPAPVFLTVTKGFIKEENKIKTVSERAFESFKRKFDSPVSWFSIGGPVKAMELSRFIPTASVYAGTDELFYPAVKSFSTKYYRVIPSSDVTGVELCSALKNVYSIALGICDGLYKNCDGGYYDNIKAMLLSCAASEMSRIVTEAGGLEKTAAGLAGVGDLYVTAQSGRNRKYGELVGRGLDPAQAYMDMFGQDEAAEGYAALKHTVKFVRDNFPHSEDRLPLLKVLYRIIYEKEKCLSALNDLIDSCYFL